MSNKPLIAEVQLKKRATQLLDYLIPNELVHQIEPGSLVKVPLRNESLDGILEDQDLSRYVL